MSIILVQMADDQWTQRAMHLACTMAQQNKARIVLLWLVSVPNPGWLGAGLSEFIPTKRDTERQAVYTTIARDYGVECMVQRMDYYTLYGALVSAVDLLDAQVVFTKLPRGIFPLWDKFRLWDLRRQLSARDCELHTLNEPPEVAASLPSINSV
ncbi:MAG: hypothetical protein KJ065_21290 [Anaerolineae bacterium]|nr:hypothetical protein [Anaerolineae bacterium]